MTSSRTRKIKGQLIAAVILCLFLTYECLPWYRWADVCHPLNDQMGIKSSFTRFGSAGPFIDYFANAEGLDINVSTLFDVPYSHLKADAPHLVPLLEPERLSMNGGVDGIIYPVSYDTPKEGWKGTAINDGIWYALLGYKGELTKGLHWVDIDDEENLPWPIEVQFPSHNRFALFTRPPTAPDEEDNWDYYKAMCSGTPDEYRRFKTADDHIAVAYCEFMLIHKGLRVQYGISYYGLDDYQLIENYIRDEMLCELPKP